MSSPHPDGEFGFIANLLAPLTGAGAEAFSLTDDAAVLSVDRDRDLAVTKDLIVAGRHFLPEDPGAAVAQRLIRVNLSDLAAMGATPRTYFLGLALPDGLAPSWLEDFVSGLADDQARFGMTLGGGDTVTTAGPAVLSLTAVGELARGAVLRRSGAVAGDDIYVTGTIGDAALGLRAVRGALTDLSMDDRAALEARFRLPMPRLGVGGALAGIATSAIDVSDGLIADLGHVARASGVALRIEADAIPLSDAARNALAADPALHPHLLTGGDDYELAFSAPREQRATIAELATRTATPIARVGLVERGAGVTVLDAAGRAIPFAEQGYRHF